MLSFIDDIRFNLLSFVLEIVSSGLADRWYANAIDVSAKIQYSVYQDKNTFGPSSFSTGNIFILKNDFVHASVLGQGQGEEITSPNDQCLEY
ncbi:MAG: hypothetical protein OXC57_04010 [Rhodobacteraceae bacterium]|nr:hypothetical protein [Paracoccaceae bacterium]